MEAESRQNEAKKIVERRRNIIVLASRFFQDLGYINAVQAIQTDTNVSLDRIDAADNIDLASIVTEFEDYYEMRFGRKPKLTRKVVDERADRKDNMDRKCSLPKLPPDGGEQRGSTADDADSKGSRRREKSSQRAKSQEPTGRKDRPPVPPGELEPAVQKKGTPNAGPSEGGGGFDGGLVGLEVGGKKVAPGSAAGGKKEAKAVEDTDKGEDFYDNQLLKVLPTAGMDKEYKELAMGIQRDILTKNPGVTWDTIVGLNHAKSLLKEAVVMPLKYPQFFTGLLAPWKGVLLFGPPGTGKTLLAKAVATECETTFFNISASTVVSKWRGDSEKLVRVLFDLARFHQPSTIFIDELDSLMSARGGGDSEHEGSRRMKTELLIQMDGLLRETQEQVFLLAASNLPWDLDSAMLRRLEKRVLVNLPEKHARAAMFKTSLPEGFAEKLDYDRLAGLTEEWSGSDIRLLCKEAGMHPLRRLMKDIERAEAAPVEAKSNKRRAADKAKEKDSKEPTPIADLKVGAVTEADVEQALKTVHRAPAAHLDKYVEWQEQFGAA